MNIHWDIINTIYKIPVVGPVLSTVVGPVVKVNAENIHHESEYIQFT